MDYKRKINAKMVHLFLHKNGITIKRLRQRSDLTIVMLKCLGMHEINTNMKYCKILRKVHGYT